MIGSRAVILALGLLSAAPALAGNYGYPRDPILHQSPGAKLEVYSPNAGRWIPIQPLGDTLQSTSNHTLKSAVSSAALQVKQSITKAGLAGITKNLIRGGLIGAGIAALVDVLRDSNITINSDGTLTKQRSDAPEGATDQIWRNSSETIFSYSHSQVAQQICSNDAANRGKTCGTVTQGTWASNGAPYGAWNYHYQILELDGSLNQNETTAVYLHGTCPSGQVYNGSSCVVPGLVAAPATDQEIVDAVTAAPIADLVPLAEGIADAGHGQLITDGSGASTVSGPPSLSGGSETSTSTGPDGQTTTTTSTMHNLAYQGNDVTVETVQTKTVTAPDGSQTVTTNRSTGDGGSTPPPTVEMCPPGSTASACAQLGTEADGAAIPVEDRAVGLVQEGSADGTCPADLTITFVGQVMSFTYEPVCRVASALRPLVIASAWLSAGIFVFGVARGSKA